MNIIMQQFYKVPTLVYLINREDAITVLIMVCPQKHNRIGCNNCLSSDISENFNKRVGLLLNKEYLIIVPVCKKNFFL